MDAVKILKDYLDRKKNFRNSLEIGVCPICEEDLQLFTPDIGKNIIGQSMSHNIPDKELVICPFNHPLIDPEKGDQAEIKNQIWRDCQNPRIKTLHWRIKKSVLA